MRKERYERLKKLYETKHEDICSDAIEAICAEESIKELDRKIREKQQQLISLSGGYDSELNVALEYLMDLYGERESKLFEALYILGVCDADIYL